MKRKILILIIAFFSIVFNIFSDKEIKNNPYHANEGMFSKFLVDGYFFNNKLFLYSKIPGNEITFEKEESKYISKIYIIVEVKNFKDELLIKKNYSYDFIIDNKKNINNLMYVKQHIIDNVSADKYKVNIYLLMRTSNYLISSREIIIDGTNQKVDKNIYLSPLIFINEVAFDKYLKDSYYIKYLDNYYIPYVSNKIEYRKNRINLVYNIAFRDSIPEKIKIKYEIKDSFNKIVVENDTIVNKSDKKLLQIIYTTDIDSLKSGDYELTVYVNDKAETSKRFKIEGMILPFIDSFDLAVRSIKYIASNKEYNEIIKEKNEDKKRELFENFWAKRDQTPQTPENEYMIEYYRRVMLAQSKFSTSGEGWKSDRGRIFIKYGEPDEIEDHPFNISTKAYQIWYYYGLRKKFIFVDERGFGDYELFNFEEE